VGNGQGRVKSRCTAHARLGPRLGRGTRGVVTVPPVAEGGVAHSAARAPLGFLHAPSTSSQNGAHAAVRGAIHATAEPRRPPPAPYDGLPVASRKATITPPHAIARLTGGCLPAGGAARVGSRGQTKKGTGGRAGCQRNGGSRP